MVKVTTLAVFLIAALLLLGTALHAAAHGGRWRLWFRAGIAVAQEQGRSLSENARALALVNMAISDSLVASFLNKYHYNFWRPETAIHAGDTDGNPKTDPNPSFVPFITTPCFPSYPSNHGSGSGGGAEILRRVYGEAGHSITLTNPSRLASSCFVFWISASSGELNGP